MFSANWLMRCWFVCTDTRNKRELLSVFSILFWGRMGLIWLTVKQFSLSKLQSLICLLLHQMSQILLLLKRKLGLIHQTDDKLIQNKHLRLIFFSSLITCSIVVSMNLDSLISVWSYFIYMLVCNCNQFQRVMGKKGFKSFKSCTCFFLVGAYRS